MLSSPRYIIVVEHDLSVLDYLSDFICCLYGVPSAYGVVTMPFGVREGRTLNTSYYTINTTLSVRSVQLLRSGHYALWSQGRPNYLYHPLTSFTMTPWLLVCVLYYYYYLRCYQLIKYILSTWQVTL